MNTVYIVVSGIWDEYTIEKVFFNKKKANKYCEEMNRKYPRAYYRAEPWNVSDNEFNN